MSHTRDWAGRPISLSSDFWALQFITACWITAVILVNPLGEFPSVDDWSYAAAVRALVERGEIRFSDWTGVNLLSQVFWGGLFALPFGVSYTALRISTLVAALLGAFALFRLVRDAERPVSIALLAALLFLFNPIFFALSFSFMSDVPFVAAQTGAMLFLFAGLRSGSRSMSTVGWVLALVALLCRQAALAIPIAYAGAYLVKHGLRAKTVLIALLPVAALAGAQWGYVAWLNASGRMPALYGASPLASGSLSFFVGRIFELERYVFFYLGLFLIPISVPAVGAIAHALPRKLAVTLLVAVTVITAVVAVTAIHAGLIMPIWPHTWHAAGLAADSAGVNAPKVFSVAATVLSVLGGVLLFICVARATYDAVSATPARGLASWGFVFGVIGALALMAVLSLINFKYDRYLLPIVPWLALLVALSIRAPPNWNTLIPRWSLLASGAFLAGMAWYSIVNEHNHMAEKRVRAGAIIDLTAQGVPRDTIDPGWVFNGELYDRFGIKVPKREKMDAATARAIIFPKYWYRSRDYVVGTRGEPDYVLLRRYPVPRWPIWGSTGPDILVYGPKTGSE